MKTIVNNIQEAVKEIQNQLQDKDWYMDNYRLLNNVEEYLDKAKEICKQQNEDFNEGEQIYNYLAYDLKWEENESELFPMQL